MSNANQYLQDEYTKHQINLGRYSTRSVNKMYKLLKAIENDVIAKLANADLSASRRAQLETFLDSIRDLYKNAYKQVSNQIESDLKDVAQLELDFTEKTTIAALNQAQITAALNTPTYAQIYAAVEAKPFQGALLKEWLTDLEANAAKRVRDAIRMGFVEGESISTIIKRLRGTKAANYKDGIMDISRRGAEAMIRTAVNHTAQATRQEIFKQNESLIDGELYNAILDARTTTICGGLSGKVFPIGEGARPPQHINCRSYMSPIIKGIEPPPRTTYNEWLKRQDASVQDEILGKTKADLWRKGEVSLDKFTDNGRELSIKELKAKYGV